MSPNIAVPDTHQPSYHSKVDRSGGDSSELRKTLKPLMEKRRRARINESLNHLKTLILPLIGKDSSRYSKLEKADILEMTVRFLKELPPAQTQTSSESYREGYRACISRVGSILAKTSLLDTDTSGRLLEHLQRSPELAACPPTTGCEQSSGTPRIVLRLSAARRAETRPAAPAPQVPPRPEAAPQSPNAPVWRPW
ncbi:transcription factor HES-2 [Ambystoma mexicanum]|uniref:transcription factor HES-2 n=1 Tax=Ambystoma mexicanum TaxID=8296 RepID=UPI0037E92272